MNMELELQGSKRREWGMILCSKGRRWRGEREGLGRQERESELGGGGGLVRRREEQNEVI